MQTAAVGTGADMGRCAGDNSRTATTTSLAAGEVFPACCLALPPFDELKLMKTRSAVARSVGASVVWC